MKALLYAHRNQHQKGRSETMGRKDECGLFGSLYYYLKENVSIFRRAEEFYSFITSDRSSAGKNPRKISYFIRYDCLTEKVSHALISELREKDTYMKRFSDITMQMNYMQLSVLSASLAEFVRKTDVYCSRIPQGNAANNEFLPYPPALREDLALRLSGSGTADPTAADPDHAAELLYLYIFFAASKTLPAKAASAAFPEYGAAEYARLVTDRYPSGGEAAVLAEKALADRDESPNPTASFRCGMRLLAETPGHRQIPDPGAAFRYFCRSAGILLPDGLRKNAQKTANTAAVLPISGAYGPALWGIAYIVFSYRRPLSGRKNPLENCAEIRELETLSDEERLRCAVSFAASAAQSPDPGAALCLLGRISREIPEDRREEFGLQSPDTYFRQSSESGYIYAETNAAADCADRILSGSGDAAPLLQDYEQHLLRAADFGIGWAANRLGLFYLDGRILPSVPAESAGRSCFPDHADREKSLRYLNRAAKGLPGKSSSWALANRLAYIPEYYSGDMPSIMRDLEEIASLGNTEALLFLQKELNTGSPYSSRNTPVILLYLDQLIRED